MRPPFVTPSVRRSSPSHSQIRLVDSTGRKADTGQIHRGAVVEETVFKKRSMFRASVQQFDVSCPKCGGLGGISKRHRILKSVLRRMGLYAFRCQSCKRRFFRFRPVRKWPSQPS